MKRKSLFGLILLLFLSTVAFSNERSRLRCGTTGHLPCPAACRHDSVPARQIVKDEDATSQSSHPLLHTIIKLLYI